MTHSTPQPPADPALTIDAPAGPPPCMPYVDGRTPNQWRAVIREAADPIRDPVRTMLSDYLLFGTPPGDLLDAVLANDLQRAVLAAPDADLQMLRAIFAVLEQAAPAAAWGSRANAEQWIIVGGIYGVAFQYAHDKQQMALAA